MAKLGYTFYPKDWNTSDSVFELNLMERGLYRELIDLAMLNDNKIDLKIDIWARKFNSTIVELENILNRLKSLGIVEIIDDKLFIPSCEKRLVLVRAGREGGSNRKKTDIEANQQSISEGYNKGDSKELCKGLGKGYSKGYSKGVSQPKEKEIEIENKGNGNEKKEISATNDNIFPLHIDRAKIGNELTNLECARRLCREPTERIAKEAILIKFKIIPTMEEFLDYLVNEFITHRNSTGKLTATMHEFREHLNNWLPKCNIDEKKIEYFKLKNKQK